MKITDGMYDSYFDYLFDKAVEDLEREHKEKEKNGKQESGERVHRADED